MKIPLLLLPAGVLLIAADRAPPMPREARPTLFEQVGTPALEPLLRLQGMSDAGIAALRHVPRGDDGDPASATKAACAAEAVAAKSPLDVAALDRALAAGDAATAAQATNRHRRLIAYLRALSPADATILLKVVGTGDASHRGGPPPGPGGPGGPPPGDGDHGPPPGGPGLICPAG